MTSPLDVAVLVGSRPRGSRSRRVAECMRRLAPATLDLEIVEISALPSTTLAEGGCASPSSWRDFRGRVGPADAVVFVSPEYDRSMATILKTALDVGSPLHGRNVWAGKRGGIVGVSPGRLDGYVSNRPLRRSLDLLEVSVMERPGVGVVRSDRCSTAAVRAIDELDRIFLLDWLETFDTWLRSVSRPRAFSEYRGTIRCLE